LETVQAAVVVRMLEMMSRNKNLKITTHTKLLLDFLLHLSHNHYEKGEYSPEIANKVRPHLKPVNDAAMRLTTMLFRTFVCLIKVSLRLFHLLILVWLVDMPGFYPKCKETLSCRPIAVFR
jgi:hypothetical protein